MKVPANWNAIVEKINGTSTDIGWNTGEGLGMTGFNIVEGGEEPDAGAACWQAGNQLIVVNAMSENESELEMISINKKTDPANVEAINTWQKLISLIDKADFTLSSISYDEDENEELINEIPDHLWDRKAVEMWLNGHTNTEIAHRVNVSPRTVTNRISILRKKFPNIVISNNERRRRQIK